MLIQSVLYFIKRIRENRMLAVFRPGLRNCLELDISRLALVIPDGIHRRKIERQCPLAANLHEFLVAHIEINYLRLVRFWQNNSRDWKKRIANGTLNERIENRRVAKINLRN